MKLSEEYFTTSASDFVSFDEAVFLSVEVLPILIGHKWDDIALGYVHSLRPSSIRVSTGSITLDSRPWRVTVIVDGDNRIQNISQEVTAGAPESIRCGEHMHTALVYGIDSPQSKWYDDDTISGYFYDGINGIYYKRCSEGLVPFPETEDTITE